METTTRQPGVRVPLVEEEHAEGRTAELYEEIKAVTGLPFVPDMFRLTSTNPRLLRVLVTGYGGIFTGDVLPRHLTELISAWTSKLNGCPYCVGTHSWFLSQFGGSDELLDAVATANTAEELPVDERTMPLMQLVTKVSTGAYKITGFTSSTSITLVARLRSSDLRAPVSRLSLNPATLCLMRYSPI